MKKRQKIEIKNYLFEISIIVLTYNPPLNKLIDTLESILCQENVKFQIVITDDGSIENYFAEIKKYFYNKNFKDFYLVSNNINQGTVLNTYAGLKYAEGKYMKGISPGDKLYTSDTLRKWVDYMEKKRAVWSFSEALYYQDDCNGKPRPISVAAHPNDLSPYIKRDDNKMRWNYVVLNDIALGAATLCITSFFADYCKKIINKVIYTEDTVWKLMMFDGIVGSYYPKFTILYEYGSGISTCGNDGWQKKIKNDWDCASKIMISKPELMDNFQKAMMNAEIINKGTSIWKKFLISGKIKSYIKRHINVRKTVPYFP